MIVNISVYPLVVASLRVAELSDLSDYTLCSRHQPSYGLTMIKNVFVGSQGVVASRRRRDRCHLRRSSLLARWKYVSLPWSGNFL